MNVVPLRRRMQPRDPHEAHRVATPLELFFDLVFVVAIASAAAQWHHGLAAGHPGDLVGFVMVFFAIWWAWMNYTWFASSYDCDDVVYRLLTFAIMAGSLMLAGGIP
jgi:low temperature requirement protein LtrA